MHCKGACMKPLLDVLMILDALEKEGSFAAASAKLYKTPSALSYTVHKLESDLNIQLLDRSGHRAKFTRTGKMLLEKGREVLHTVRELEKQAIKLHEGWENELVIGVDDTFPFSLLAPLIEAFVDKRIEKLLFNYRARNFPGTLDYAEQQRWLEHRRQVFTPEFLQGYADELQMLAQQYADDKEKVALLKALWQYAEEIV